MALALAGLAPVVELALDPERIHLDLDDETADAAGLPGAVGADRIARDLALDAGFLIGLGRRLPRLHAVRMRPLGKIQWPRWRDVTRRKTGVASTIA